MIVGHDAISGFRSARAAIPSRAVTRLHVRVLAADHVLIMARTADGAATGLQTQLWRLTEAPWRVAAAHVSLPSVPPATPTAFDRSVWRGSARRSATTSPSYCHEATIYNTRQCFGFTTTTTAEALTALAQEGRP